MYGRRQPAPCALFSIKEDILDSVCNKAIVMLVKVDLGTVCLHIKGGEAAINCPSNASTSVGKVCSC